LFSCVPRRSENALGEDHCGVFDVRGVVELPLTIDVEVTELNGERRVWSFKEGIARLVMHEIDHLSGRLYTDGLVPDTDLVPLEQYRDARDRWHY
jgi:peptide deformylase